MEGEIIETMGKKRNSLDLLSRLTDRNFTNYLQTVSGENAKIECSTVTDFRRTGCEWLPFLVQYSSRQQICLVSLLYAQSYYQISLKATFIGILRGSEHILHQVGTISLYAFLNSYQRISLHGNSGLHLESYVHLHEQKMNFAEFSTQLGETICTQLF